MKKEQTKARKETERVKKLLKRELNNLLEEFNSIMDLNLQLKDGNCEVRANIKDKSRVDDKSIWVLFILTVISRSCIEIELDNLDIEAIRQGCEMITNVVDLKEIELEGKDER